MLTPCVSLIMLANAAVFLLQIFIQRTENLQLAILLTQFQLTPRDIPYQPWTLVTYMFMHAGFGHILFNMLSLFFFGPRLEAQLGLRKFAGLYLVSGIAGGLLSWVFTPNAHIVGASGAVLGVMFGYALYWPKDQIFLMFVPMQVRVALVVMTLLDLFGGFSGAGSTAHFAHLGGFAGAFAYLRLVDIRPSRQRRFEAQQKGPRVSQSDLDRWAKIPREQLHEVNRDELDRIMEKIEKQGIASVTPQERVFLDNFSERTGS
jgi:membrane associated rhomboid family serine protease